MGRRFMNMDSPPHDAFPRGYPRRPPHEPRGKAVGEGEIGLQHGTTGHILPLGGLWASIARSYNLGWVWDAELRPLLRHPKSPPTGARRGLVASTMVHRAMIQNATFRLNLAKSFWGTSKEHVEHP